VVNDRLELGSFADPVVPSKAGLIDVKAVKLLFGNI
jgi:hypothetical protein